MTYHESLWGKKKKQANGVALRLNDLVAVSCSLLYWFPYYPDKPEVFTFCSFSIDYQLLTFCVLSFACTYLCVCSNWSVMG